MDHLNTLIAQYWAGELRPSDKQMLAEMLSEDGSDFSEEEYRVFIQLVSEKQTLLNKQDPALTLMLIAINNHLHPAENKRATLFNISRKKRWQWMAAASLLAIIISMGWWTAMHVTNTRAIAEIEPVWITISTDAYHSKDTTMSDGSFIRMYAGTSISFIDGFKQKERSIKMNGKALFRVRGNTSHPFIVHAGGFTTEALGTAFEINTQQKNRFSARLLEGKVVVKTVNKTLQPMEDVYLSPNEQLEYDLQKKAVTLNSNNSTTGVIVKKETITKRQEAIPDVTFSKLPLSIVFKMLEDEYAITIVYDMDKVSGMEYSGTFKKSEHPSVILKKIVAQHHLKLTKEAGAYRIE